MKTLKIEVGQIPSLINLLNVLEFTKSKPKRGKAKLMRNLVDKYNEFREDLEAIQKDYYQVNEKGELKKNDAGKFVPKEGVDENEFDDEVQELLDEEVIVDLVEHETKIRSFYEALDNDEFSEQGKSDDYAFDILMDKFEVLFEEEK